MILINSLYQRGWERMVSGAAVKFSCRSAQIWITLIQKCPNCIFDETSSIVALLIPKICPLPLFLFYQWEVFFQSEKLNRSIYLLIQDILSALQYEKTSGRVLTKVLKWWVPGLITFENGESHQILVSPNPKMMSPDFSYNKPLSESLTFHKSWVHVVSFKCIYKLK